MLSRNRSDVKHMNESGTTGVLCDSLSPGPRRQTGLLAVPILIRSVAIFAVLFVIHFAVCKYNSEFRVHVQLPSVTYVDNVTLPAFPPPLLQQSIDISCPPGPQQQTCISGVWRPGGTDGQTDGRPTVAYTLLRAAHITCVCEQCQQSLSGQRLVHSYDF